jgi:hypothetical protein
MSHGPEAEHDEGPHERRDDANEEIAAVHGCATLTPTGRGGVSNSVTRRISPTHPASAVTMTPRERRRKMASRDVSNRQRA